MFQKKINWYRQVWLAIVGRSPAAKSFCLCWHLPTLLAGTPVRWISSRLRVISTMWIAVEDIKKQTWMGPCCPQEQVSSLFIWHFFNVSLKKRTQWWKTFQTLTSWVKTNTRSKYLPPGFFASLPEHQQPHLLCVVLSHSLVPLLFCFLVPLLLLVSPCLFPFLFLSPFLF